MSEPAMEQIGVELRTIARRIKQGISRRAAEIHPDLQPGSYLVLCSLAEHGPTRASSLTCTFGMDKGTISRYLQHLRDLGLVDRETDPADARAALVHATEAAHRRLAEAASSRGGDWEQRLSSWDTADLESFGDYLARFNATFE